MASFFKLNKLVKFVGTKLTQNVHQSCNMRSGKEAEPLKRIQSTENKFANVPDNPMKSYGAT